MFSKAIVRTPARSMVNGLTQAGLGLPEYHKALAQHAAYVDALVQCGLEVTQLDADEQFPDSTFVEDTALLTPSCAIITNPGAPSRRGEVHEIKTVIGRHYADVAQVRVPGTLDAGDIMMVGDQYYIGLSARTNLEGATQLVNILDSYGMAGSFIKLEKVLHLKTGLSYLENNNLLVCGEFLASQDFNGFNIIEIPAEESYAANSLWVNGTVLVPRGYPETRAKILGAGYPVIELDMSEFRKLDGGLSCLSLRF